MHIDPRKGWLSYSVLIGPAVFIFFVFLTPIPVIILGIIHPPVLWLFLFFYTLKLIHVYIVPIVFRTRIRYLGVILMYSAPVDVVLLCLQKRLTMFLLFPPVIVSLLLFATEVTLFIVTYHTTRNILNKFPNEELEKGIKKLHVESNHRQLLNFYILAACYVTVILGSIYRFPLPTLFLRFFEIAVLFIFLGSIRYLLYHARELSRSFGFPTLPIALDFSQGRDLQITPHFMDISRHRNVEGGQGMPLYSFDTQDELIDFYDRAGEIRKTTYYSALLMVAVLGVYLSCYALVPGTFVSIPIEAVLLICLILAVLFVHVPFMLGRERVIMELTAGFSGSKFRDICDLLRRKTPTWNPRLLGLLIGAGALGPVGAWILKCVTETLKRAQ